MLKFVAGILVFVIGFVLQTASISAAEKKWTLAEINDTIEQTNFVVNSGCSGTLISIKLKLILTNYHCVEEKVSIIEREVTTDTGITRKVRFRKYGDVDVVQHGYDNFARVSTSSYFAEIVAAEKSRDLAVLKIRSAIPHRLASRILPDTMKVVRGERVYVVGNPAGLDATIVEGIVSNLNRTFTFSWTDNEKLAMIQFSGGIYGGNSGGALYNAQGYLIGVPAAGNMNATFIGLAIPIDLVRKVLKDNCLSSAYSGNEDEDVKCAATKKKRAEDEEKKANSTVDK